jgi:hypothetical protein
VSPDLFSAFLCGAEDRVADLTMPIEVRARASEIVDACLALLTSEAMTREELRALVASSVGAAAGHAVRLPPPRVTFVMPMALPKRRRVA